MGDLATEEVGGVERGLVHEHGHVLGLDELHDALDVSVKAKLNTCVHLSLDRNTQEPWAARDAAEPAEAAGARAAFARPNPRRASACVRRLRAAGAVAKIIAPQQLRD